MSLIVLMHHPDEGPALLGAALVDVGHELQHVELFAGATLPTSLDGVEGIISMGGPMNVDQVQEHAWITPEMALLKAAHEKGIPVVGICLGAQLIAAALGGQVAAMPRPPGPEIGWHNLRLTFPGTSDTIFTGLPWNSVPFHLHGQEAAKLPLDAVPLAGSVACRSQAFRVGRTTYGFQYHFEWDRRDLALAARCAFVTDAGLAPEEIEKQTTVHYDAYRRLGDRLCGNLATYLFPIDRKIV
jgi:GMP synthase (glutamine-hydrolysing)